MLVECTCTHAPFRQRHMLSGTCTLTRLPVHAQPCAHTCSPAGPAPRASPSSSLNIGEPGRREGRRAPGVWIRGPASASLCGGWAGTEAGPLGTAQGGSLSTGRPGPLCTVGAPGCHLLCRPLLPCPHPSKVLGHPHGG